MLSEPVSFEVTNSRHLMLVDAGDAYLFEGKRLCRGHWGIGVFGCPYGGTVTKHARREELVYLGLVDRLVLGLTDPDQFSRFINGDRYDNRRENLLVVARTRQGEAPTLAGVEAPGDKND